MSRVMRVLGLVAFCAATGMGCDAGNGETDAGRGDTDGGVGDTDGGVGDTDAGSTMEGPVGVVFSTVGTLGVAAADGTNIRVRDAQGATSHVLSPDGTMIAYRSAGDGMLWVVPVAGGTPLQLSTHTVLQARSYDYLFYAWSPDSRRLVYQSGHDKYIVSVDGTQETQVCDTSASNGGGLPRFSSDSNWVAYTNDGGGDYPRLWVIAADASGSPMEITAPAGGRAEAELRYFAWSPTANQLAFSQALDRTRTFVADHDGGNRVELTTRGRDNGPYNSAPVWANDGNAVYYIEEPSRFAYQVWRSAPDGSANALFNAPAGDNRQISPDGNWFSYTRSNLFVMPSDGSGAPVDHGRAAASPPRHPGYRWAPDSSRVARAASSLHTALPDGTSVVDIHAGGVSAGGYGWGGATSIAYSDGLELWVADAAGGGSEQLTDYAGDPRVSALPGWATAVVDTTSDGRRLCEAFAEETNTTTPGLTRPANSSVRLWVLAGSAYTPVDLTVGDGWTIAAGCTLIE